MNDNHETFKNHMINKWHIQHAMTAHKKNQDMLDKLSKTIFALDHADEMLYPMGNGEYITKKAFQSAIDKYQDDVAKQCVSPSYYIMSEGMVKKIAKIYDNNQLFEVEHVTPETVAISDKEMLELDLPGADIVKIDGKKVKGSFYDHPACRTIYILED